MDWKGVLPTSTSERISRLSLFKQPSEQTDLVQREGDPGGHQAGRRRVSWDTAPVLDHQARVATSHGKTLAVMCRIDLNRRAPGIDIASY